MFIFIKTRGDYMRRNDYIYNLLMTIMFILILILNNFIVKGILSQKIVLDLIVGLLFIIGSFLKLKNVKNCFRSIEFIYGFCFFIYSFNNYTIASSITKRIVS